MTAPPDRSPLRPWLAPLVCAVVALVVRAALIARLPEPWHFDAYQRWAARDHLVVQVWLPGTQALIWLVAKAGGGVLAVRAVMAALGALVVGMGAALAQRLGGPRASWAFLPFALFGPFVAWSVVPYQEGTFLACIFGALLLVRRAPLLADLTMGAVALVRYEGWPLLVLWLGLRRDPRALVSLWGAALWLALKQAGLAEGVAASPDSFEDWNRLDRHLKPRWLRLLTWGLWYHLVESGTLFVLVPALAAARAAARRGWRALPLELTFIAVAFAGQCAAVLGWALSLGNASSRMMVVTGLLLAVPAATAIARAWEGWRGRRRFALGVAVIGVTVWSARDGWNESVRHVNYVRWELDLIPQMQACTGDVWALKPRVNPGPRRRHDGCEVVQGVTHWRAGRDFACLKWGQELPDTTLIARWDRHDDRYRIERVGGTPAPGCAW